MLIVRQAETSAAAQANPEQGKDFLESFKQFVTGEKKRLQPKKAAATSKAKDDKLAEMIKFSQTFKVCQQIMLQPILMR